MTIHKNFVVKNGIEVNTNLIFGDTGSNKVGIATTNPKYTLHVNGGIGATNSVVSGVSTVNDLVIGGKVSAGSSFGSAGQYLVSTGTGVTWGAVPTVRSTDLQTAGVGATTFSTTYTVGLLDVYVNGVKLSSNEYTANNGATVALNDACFGGETVEFISYSPFGIGVGGTSIQGITILEEGSQVGGALQVTSINFVGAAVTAVGSGIGVTVYISDTDTTNPNYWVSTAAGIHTLSNVGVGTTNPGEKLQVDGNIRVGISTTSNYITFYGTYKDGPLNVGGELPYQHTYIGERIYDYSGSEAERSELLLFKGNDTDGVAGPDRIRLFAGEHRLDVLGFNTSGTFEQVGVSTAAVNAVTVNAIGVGIGTTNPRFALEVGAVGASGTTLYVNGNARITGILTVGSSSITLNGPSNTINVGSGVTIDGTAGTISATSFVGDGSGLIGVIGSGSGIVVLDDGSTVGTAGTIDFGANLTVSAISAGVVTVTASGGTSSQWVSTGVGIHTLSNVGVGTTNPTSALTVTGSGTSTSQLYVSGVSTCTNKLDVVFSSGLNPGINLNDTSNNTLIGMYYDTSSTQSYLISTQKNLNLKVYAPQDVHILAGDETMAVFESNAGVSLYYDNSKKFETIGAGVTVTGTTFTNQLNVSGVSTLFGNVGVGTTNPTSALTVAGSVSVSGVSTFTGPLTLTGTNNSNLTIDGSNIYYRGAYITRPNGGYASWIYNYTNDTFDFGSVSAPLTLQGKNYITFQDDNGKTFATFNKDSSVQLAYNNTYKFETIGSGVTVTGQISASAGVLAGFSTFTSIRVANDAGNNTSQYITVIGQNYVIGFNTGGGYPENKYFQFSSGNPNFILENVGIGTTNATSKLTVRGGDISVGVSTAHGVILTSPNGTQYRLIVDNSGTLSTVAV